MTLAAVRSKAMVLLSVNHFFLLLLPLFFFLFFFFGGGGGGGWGLCSVRIMWYHLAGEKRAGCFTLIAYLHVCHVAVWCSVPLNHAAVDWSAVCGCAYTLTF